LQAMVVEITSCIGILLFLQSLFVQVLYTKVNVSSVIH
jgi:hypothetical protein